jgi:spore coat polysaccharide biosynthesis protein SpsF
MAKTIGIIQCRMSSARLPGKVMLDLGGEPLLMRVVQRCQMAHKIDKLIVATSTDKSDDVIESLCRARGLSSFRGSLSDVRSRFLEITKAEGADYVVRITADNPLTEPIFIDQLISESSRRPNSPYFIMKKELIPYGSGVEVFTAKSLIDSAKRFSEVEDLEHVTTGIRKIIAADGLESVELLPASEFIGAKESVSVDTREDYLRVSRMISQYGFDKDTLKKVVLAQRVSSL